MNYPSRSILVSAAAWFLYLSLPFVIAMQGKAAEPPTAPPPQWIEASVPPPAGQAVIFARSFELSQAPTVAMIRLNASDRYRLSINDRPVSVGDTPWDGETYDLTAFLRPGSNRVEVSADVPRYDSSSVITHPRIYVDMRAWSANGELLRLSSGADWSGNGAAAHLVGRNKDWQRWRPVALAGPKEPTQPPLAATVSLDVGQGNGIAGQRHTVRVNVWACSPMPEARVRIRAENWSGAEVINEEVPLTWDGAVGRAEFQTPALARGLYRFDATLPGISNQSRHTALAVLAPGETRLSSVFDTLTPIVKQKGGPIFGIDADWALPPDPLAPALLFGIRDLGVNFVLIPLKPEYLDNGSFADILAFCKATGLRFTIQNEAANGGNPSLAPDGHDRFATPDGCHRWDIEPAALEAAVATGLFEGVVYDEAEHMQLSRNGGRVGNKPFMVETNGMTLPQAREAFVDATRKVSDYYRQHKTRMITEDVFPALWHPLAQAGVTLCPKLLKEGVSPVVMALSLGAAKQYGAELWYSPDLWFMDDFPGHSLAEYERALRLAHAAGVDNVYTEHFVGLCRVHGAAYDMTGYGEVLRTFIRDYLPTHPRAYTYRDYEPEVAIIRFPDSDWGQGSNSPWSLYGAENLRPTPETAEWMQVFGLLTNGKTGGSRAYLNGHPSYIPAPPTAVYDHLAGPELLRGVDTIFLCGITVSEATLAAVEDRVKQGAICFAPARLCPDSIRKKATQLPARVDDGSGAWIILAGYQPKDLGPFSALVPQAGDAFRMKFKGQTVRVEK